MAEKFSLKDELFNADTVAHLGGLFAAADASFDADKFQSDVMERLLELELKERMNWIADVLGDHLPDDFVSLAQRIVKALPPPLDPDLTDDDFGRFIYAPLGVLVERHGIENHVPLSFQALEEITQRFSMEFSVRPFLNAWPIEAMQQMDHWTQHPNYHVRRLASEGTRPKLPWGQGISIDPMQALPILDALHADPTRFVTRSVANHLNDIAKIDPDAVIDRLSAWAKEGQQAPKELAWMTRHALRGLIKSGHPGALELLGYRPDAAVTLKELTLSSTRVPIDTALAFELTLEAAREEPVIVDYIVHFMKSNGAQSGKTFKIKSLTLKPNVKTALSKSHMFKGNATTFRLYPGAHRISIQVNGRDLGGADFELV